MQEKQLIADHRCLKADLWLARQPLPADTRPAERPPAGPALPEALRCGSAPELSATVAKPLNGGKP